jgi:NTP pyrophosphatase (non-canonical NTP hydrolase)
MKGFLDILAIARENVRKNPTIVDGSTEAMCHRYINGLRDEVTEVADEIKENNAVYLEDELSDIAWDYATLIALAEYRGLIPSAEAVLEHGFLKYSERTPAFLEGSQDLWNEIKTKQKERLKHKHEALYGN